MDPLWQLDEYDAKLLAAQQRIQSLAAFLNQARRNAQC
jgi:hypothetical protein